MSARVVLVGHSRGGGPLFCCDSAATHLLLQLVVGGWLLTVVRICLVVVVVGLPWVVVIRDQQKPATCSSVVVAGRLGQEEAPGTLDTTVSYRYNGILYLVFFPGFFIIRRKQEEESRRA